MGQKAVGPVYCVKELCLLLTYFTLISVTQAQLPTRRFLNVVLDDSHVVVRCRLSHLNKRHEGKLFTQVKYKCKRSSEVFEYLFYVSVL